MIEKMTFDEIIAELEKQDISVREFGNCDMDDTLENIGEWEEVEQKGGEGQGDEWYSVKYFPAHDIYIRTEAYYSSYEGTTFDDGYGYEVRPAQKTITVYE